MTMYCMDGRVMSQEDFRAWLLDLLDTSPELLAGLVGVTTIKTKECVKNGDPCHDPGRLRQREIRRHEAP